MKKFFLMVAVALSVASVASAQTFSNGDKKITANLGFGGGYGTPIAFSYEQGVVDLTNVMAIGVGGYLGHTSYTSNHYSYSNMYLAAMGNWHYTGVNNFDFYAGIRLGYNVAGGSWDDDSYSGSYDVTQGGLFFQTHIGANYYFNPNWAINAELGYGLASLSLGATYKF